MMMDDIWLWQVLVPTVSNEGVTFGHPHHRAWDRKVQGIAGGLTVMKPVKGHWTAPDGTVMSERMIPVQVACTREQMVAIADATASHYEQSAVMYWRVSDEVYVRHYQASTAA
jgi:hypothetical protein